ncbi:hypothetical protein F5Y18DRAFT_345846 [Xylariaceae sp. FL1019]|nr:hypothetical protein F5Y18DRAFT_345846 [Xylariaceae sp. FL1019]
MKKEPIEMGKLDPRTKAALAKSLTYVPSNMIKTRVIAAIFEGMKRRLNRGLSKWTDQRWAVVTSSGASMFPTIDPRNSLSGCHYFLHRHIRIHEIRRGMVMGFINPIAPGEYIGKRIVALEGEVVIARNGDEYAVPRGHVWIEGDNESASRDSNYYGPIPLALADRLYGRLLYPFKIMGKNSWLKMFPYEDYALGHRIVPDAEVKQREARGLYFKRFPLSADVRHQIANVREAIVQDDCRMILRCFQRRFDTNSAPDLFQQWQDGGGRPVWLDDGTCIVKIPAADCRLQEPLEHFLAMGLDWMAPMRQQMIRFELGPRRAVQQDPMPARQAFKASKPSKKGQQQCKKIRRSPDSFPR